MPCSIPLSLYIHIPWCLKICPYCDFNRQTLRGELPETEYVDALIRDFQRSIPLLEGRPIRTIFIGGGTPSLLKASSFERLLKTVFDYDPSDKEITLEANPGTFEHGKFHDYAKAGINRISLGVQSFDDHALKALGRIHDRNDVEQAIRELQLADFKQWNLDLMYGLPHQSPKQSLCDLEQAMQFEPPHLSWYELTLEPNTPFYKKPPPIPLDDDKAIMEQSGQALLAKYGYRRYEVSAYTQNMPCQHNLNYWQFGDYLGIGAGAHSKITHQGTPLRMVRLRHPDTYLSALNPVHQTWDIPSEELAFEFMLNASRLTKGFELDWFEQRTGLPQSTLTQALAQGEGTLLTIDDSFVHLTDKGRLFANELVGYFINEHSTELHA